MNFLVTGGAGFIGSAVCRLLVRQKSNYVVNLDKLAYSGNLGSLQEIDSQPNYKFVYGDICDGCMVLDILRNESIDVIINLAAESHVDRSIDSPDAFIQTNVVGTFQILEAALSYWRSRRREAEDKFRFHHVSTDEVFGELPFDRGVFREDSPYAPSSPYAASKAASDHLVRAWHRTYGLPVVVSNCSNNYGPYQYPEKLIPLMILNALDERELPVYGTGENVRDWLFVDDHARALVLVAKHGCPGQSYNIGGRAERTNLEVVEGICDIMDSRRPRTSGASYRHLIQLVSDRPGHDRRYAIDPSKIERDLGWVREETFETGLARTIDWYLENEWWWGPIRAERYLGGRLGLPS